MIRALISIGDPAGIGPEVSIKAVDELVEEGLKFIPILVGDRSVIIDTVENLRIKKNPTPLQSKKTTGNIFFVDVPVIKNRKFSKGRASALTGRASFAYLKEVWRLLQKNKGDCIITAPISKTAWNLSGISYHGHTEALSAFSKEKTYMLMAAGKICVLLATVHIPMKRIWHYLSRRNLYSATKITSEYITRFFGIRNVRIAFCGFNPHAGESETLGKEEKTIIAPVIEELSRIGFNVSGPYPADSIFRNAIKKDGIDLIVSMYHDQALPVLKTLFFEKLVNITINATGWIRTSPGHGTAFDIAWKNKACASAMKEAIKTAVKMAERK
ncbi:MAG: 4-hydroxythreonine-4-phosphate dehydrogenase PdxA [Candidatus Omnitrophica bacterium]|nr:4-hydroxythreonine-4-phosphate dehydrogenase PdxA [Candidatus Omnitrophota bacterium]